MTVTGIAYGIIGAATIAACVHMIDQGYAWWQVLLMAALGYAMLPNYIKRTNDERYLIASDGRTIIKHPNFCPNCGAKVVD